MLEINSVALDRYRILEIAGKGGMGRVYHAVDILDGSHWAIKEELTDRHALQLQEEAQVLMELDHPALPRARGVYRWQGNTYMVMQYMQGQTLAAMLKQEGKFPETRVHGWFLQICDVLCYLHSRPRSVVYRDLKPSNIIVNEQDQIRIIDFGIAEEYTKEEDTQMQKGGLTRGYAAPEQYSHRFKADVRTDIYALGATVHYLLTGKNPAKPPYGFPPVRKLVRDISPAMESIVKQCLQPNPDQRYKSAEELRSDLIHIGEKNALLIKKRNRRILAAAGVCAVVLSGLLIIGKTLQQRREEQIRAYDSVIQESRRAADTGNIPGAIMLAEEAIEMQPNEIRGYLAVGYSYLAQGDYDGCRKYIRTEILDRFPECYDDTDFLTLMAQLYDRSGNTKEALFYYRERCRLSSRESEYWLELADCCIRVGEYTEAEESLQSYLETGGEESLYQEYMAKLPK